jgi:protease I
MTHTRWLIVALTVLTLTSCAAIAQEQASWYRQPNLDRAYDLAKTRILIVAANQFNYSEAVEMAECWKRWGAEVEFTGPERTLTAEREGSAPGAASVGEAPTLRVDYLLPEVDPSRYDVLHIAGGEGVADLLTKNREQLARIIDGVHRRGKIVSAICHGPMALAASPMIKGKKLTVQGHTQRAALEQAGALVLNEVSVVDGQIVTGQWPHLETFAITLAERVRFPSGGGPYEKMMAARTPVERAIDEMRNAHRFEAKPVPPEVLERVVRAAQKACAPPSTPGCGTMKFVAIEQQTGKAKVTELLLEKSKAEYAARGIPESALRPFISSMVEQAPVLLLQFVDSPQQLAKDERDRIEPSGPGIFRERSGKHGSSCPVAWPRSLCARDPNVSFRGTGA